MDRKALFKKRLHLLVPKGLRLVGEELFVLRAVEYGQITESQIDAARKFIRRKIKKRGLLHVRAYPFLILTRKPAEVRMGKGKGTRPRAKVFPVRPGQVLFKLTNITAFSALSALRGAKDKLSVSVKIYGFRKK